MTTPPDIPARPTVLAGRYLLEGKIAAGGMGEVWRAVDQTLRRPVAVKLLRPEYASDESFLVRFRGEARHAAQLSHPGVASVYDYGEVASPGQRPTAYLVMELVEGEPLSALLHRERRIAPDRMLDIVGQAAAALDAAHALGIVHRDVKPGNLIVRNDGVVKVTDFGIARAMDAAPLTATGIMMGTAYYVSPEQASGKPVTPLSDVYSLGVVAYECLAGRRPFDDRNPIVVVMAHQNDTPPPLPPDVPGPVRALVDAALAKSPAARPPSAGAFAHSAASIRQNLWNISPTRMTGSPRMGPQAVRPAEVPAGRRARRDAAPRPPVPPPSASGADRRAPARAKPQAEPVASWNRESAWPATPAQGGSTPAGRRGRAPANGRRGAAGSGSKLPLPVLIALLLATVIVAALITRTLAGSTGGSANGAPAPGWVTSISGQGAYGLARSGDDAGSN